MVALDWRRILVAAALLACAASPVTGANQLPRCRQAAADYDPDQFLAVVERVAVVAGLYEQQTGNKIKLDVTPYHGMLEKARNAVRGTESPDDVLNLDSGWTIEFYEGGFLEPLDQIEPGLRVAQRGCRPAAIPISGMQQERFRTARGGVLMAIPPNCNAHVLA